MGNTDINKNIDCPIWHIRQSTEKYKRNRKKLITDIQSFLEWWKEETDESIYSRDLERVFICEDQNHYKYYITRGEKEVKKVDHEDYLYRIYKREEVVELETLDFAILAKIWELLPVVTKEYVSKIESKQVGLDTLARLKETTEEYKRNRRKLTVEIQAFLEKWKNETSEELHCEDLNLHNVYGRFFLCRGENSIQEARKNNYEVFYYYTNLESLDYDTLFAVWEKIPSVLEEYRKKIEEKIEKIEQVGA